MGVTSSTQTVKVAGIVPIAYGAFKNNTPPKTSPVVSKTPRAHAWKRYGWYSAASHRPQGTAQPLLISLQNEIIPDPPSSSILETAAIAVRSVPKLIDYRRRPSPSPCSSRPPDKLPIPLTTSPLLAAPSPSHHILTPTVEIFSPTSYKSRIRNKFSPQHLQSRHYFSPRGRRVLELVRNNLCLPADMPPVVLILNLVKNWHKVRLSIARKNPYLAKQANLLSFEGIEHDEGVNNVNDYQILQWWLRSGLNLFEDGRGQGIQISGRGTGRGVISDEDRRRAGRKRWMGEIIICFDEQFVRLLELPLCNRVTMVSWSVGKYTWK
ncbi:hypothetical protein QBC35DRAFT_549899 [Podospora australis]|uniref:Uncharacterized protein n=1 Tax=Podospora australis TaxID=1536484 RepID=A0AAN6WW24_9PEZI|nr:hypothetical protein QBC35DRAFT_549899 [Podospora australis]